MAPDETLIDGDLIAKFKILDVDNDGCVTTQEVKQVIKSLGVDIPDEDIETWVVKTDASGNGCVDYFEFARYMREK